MKTLTKFLTLSLVIFAFTFVDANAQASSATGGGRQALEQKVFKKILGLPYYGVFDHIAFKVDGNSVTLYGKVYSVGTKKAAEKAVRSIDGVGTVVNNIENLPLSSYDNSIRRALIREYVRAAGVYGYLQEPNPSVRIIVDNGHVTLEGYVNSRGTANYMTTLAKTVPGVFSVTNNLVTTRPVYR